MIVIGQTTFDVPEPPAMRTFALQQRIVPVLGGVLRALARVFGADKVVGADGEAKLAGILEADVEKLLPLAASALGEVFAQMPPGELESLTRELLRDATADRKPLFATAKNGLQADPFDALMRGRTADVWRLLWHALEVWYPDFFALAAGLRARAEKPAPASAA